MTARFSVQPGKPPVEGSHVVEAHVIGEAVDREVAVQCRINAEHLGEAFLNVAFAIGLDDGVLVSEHVTVTDHLSLEEATRLLGG